MKYPRVLRPHPIHRKKLNTLFYINTSHTWKNIPFEDKISSRYNVKNAVV